MAGYLLADQASLICHRQKAVEKISNETNESTNPSSPRDPENCGKTKIVFKSLRCRRGSQIMSFSVQNFKLLLLSNTFFFLSNLLFPLREPLPAFSSWPPGGWCGSRHCGEVMVSVGCQPSSAPPFFLPLFTLGLSLHCDWAPMMSCHFSSSSHEILRNQTVAP